jgi:ubiquinone/menaquinone biosynthesis C-methylase UbiE
MDRKQRELELHKILAHEYDEKREGCRNGKYYSIEWLRQMVKYIPKGKKVNILDIGCGTGILFELLKEEGFNFKYTGVDLSESMINVGKKRYPGIDLRVMDSENLEFDDKSFDVVFMRSVLHHLPNPVQALKEMKRVSQGMIIVSEPLRNVLTEFPRWTLKKVTNHFDPEHTHFSTKQLRKFFRETDISSYKIQHFGYLAYPWGFTDILPFAKIMPLSLLKVLFKTDLLISKVPLVNYFSWHSIIVCKI